MRPETLHFQFRFTDLYYLCQPSLTFLHLSHHCYSIPYSWTYPILMWLLAPYPMLPYALGPLGSSDQGFDEHRHRYRVLCPASSCLLDVSYSLASPCDLVYSCLLYVWVSWPCVD